MKRMTHMNENITDCLWGVSFHDVLPGTGKLCAGSTPAPKHRSECRCFPRSGTGFDKCTAMCISVSSCSSSEKKTTNNRGETEATVRQNSDDWKICHTELIIGLACEVYPVWHHPPLVHCHSHTGHFFSSSCTHSCACGWCLCPLQLPLAPERATGTCCPDFPSLTFPQDTKQTKQQLNCTVSSHGKRSVLINMKSISGEHTLSGTLAFGVLQ